MNVLEFVHGHFIYQRRIDVLAAWLAALIPDNLEILDVGSGDGRLASAIMQWRTDVQIRGIDILVRYHTAIPVSLFNGREIPFANSSFPAVMLVDVLHHSENPFSLLAEAVRVSKMFIIIKDHFNDGFIAKKTLRLMDRVGNERHRVALPFQYWKRKQWAESFSRLHLKPVRGQEKLRLYPFPLNLFFDRCLHFINLLQKSGPGI